MFAPPPQDLCAEKVLLVFMVGQWSVKRAQTCERVPQSFFPFYYGLFCETFVFLIILLCVVLIWCCVGKPITLSHPTRIEVELGLCQNYQFLIYVW